MRAAGVPILDAFDAAGVDVAYELYPGEDLHHGATFERFAGAVTDDAANRRLLGLQGGGTAAA